MNQAKHNLDRQTELLIISPYIPYKNVANAGGKTHYYYLCKYAEVFHTRLITFAYPAGLAKAKNDLEQLPIEYSVIERKRNFTLTEKILNKESEKNPFNRNCNMVLNTEQNDLNLELKKLKQSGYSPDVIILEWTQMLLACRNIKKIFPHAKIVASEHDVSFLAYQRKYLFSSGWDRIVKKINYKSMLRNESKALSKMDLIIVHNEKDRRLLEDNGFSTSNLHVIVPYYTHLQVSSRKNNNNILFFGAMNRPENWLSAIWFIENVFCKLKGFRFIILGGNPCPALDRFKSDDVIVTGFVDDIQPYFDNAFCFVAPLVLGGGIKVKVIEAFTSGIPVLTNSIGIEGIPAKNGVDYIHCEEPEEYIDSIMDLYRDSSKSKRIGDNGKSFIQNTFDLEESSLRVIERIKSICDDKEQSK